MLVIVTVIWDDRVLKVDVNTKRKQSHLKQILVKEHGMDRSYRLLFKGKELEERPLDEQGVADKSEITVIKPAGFVTAGKEKPKKQELGYMPQVLTDLQQHLLMNPEIMQQMMNSPAMQSLLNDEKFLESIMKMNPAVRMSLETNADFGEMLRDPEFRETASEAFRNPSTMREVLQSTELAVTELKSVPGGIEMITSMHQQLNLPEDEQSSKKSSGDEDEEARAERLEREAAEGPPAWHNACDANAMASMMQDPNLQQLMAQYMETIERDNECFSNPAFVASLFRPQNMQAIASMETAMNAMVTAKQREEMKVTPGSQFNKTFDTFLEAQKENPETKYRTQLTKMRHTGFTNTAKCIAALEETGGQVQAAIELLLKQG
mmetsp:Transcript_22164/g.55886  ORF Transcript_22164/g.55886 Transcript_22164/m.55886 type:complete len:378 (+) Transcript_22164:126-1259(+)|eukprot:CAMPEP_0178999556 /NCGR_PEP_ID=MMETSP0795-20121207/10132_1 /TAXON_ID=88552 /ORGANISM="Amoebophrya sp., Strain Ameob2" /LENGTH=377 /DNA_ID=CAMNT_0020692355 /DNA_START=115 /DNA_END=1248 /DNA_ORIENTATION=+